MCMLLTKGTRFRVQHIYISDLETISREREREFPNGRRERRSREDFHRRLSIVHSSSLVDPVHFCQNQIETIILNRGRRVVHSCTVTQDRARALPANGKSADTATNSPRAASCGNLPPNVLSS